MTFKSPTRPHCRWCGKPIRKRTTTVWVREKPSEYDHPHAYTAYVYVSPRPKNLAECKPLSNQEVIAIKRSNDGTVSSFHTWDGESYVDQFFDNGECAKRMGYAVARKEGMATKAWRDARDKMKEDA